MTENYCDLQEHCKTVQQITAQYNQVVEQNKKLQAELQPLRKPYFKDLSTETVSQLAIKSIKMTTDWINAEELIDYIEETVKNASPQNAIRIIKQQISEYRKFNGGEEC